MVKLTKKKNDVTFVDPVTMEARCTFNQCVDKFTKEDFEVLTLPNGKEFVNAFHVCNECGQRVKAKGDGTRAYMKWKEIMMSKDPDTLDPDTLAKLTYWEHNLAGNERGQ